MKIIINGKVYSKKYISGVQRFQIEIVKELDKIVHPGEFEVLIPKDAQVPEFKNIKVKRYGHLKNIMWEQIELPYYVHRNIAISLNLGNVSPMANPGIVCLHDINLLKNRKNFRFINFLWYKIVHKRTIKKAKELITVSNFSRDEIAQYYNIDKNRIHVIYNAWQHVEGLKEDKKILDKIKNITQGKKYFFSIGTLTKHKNLKWVIEVARQNPDYMFLISGFKNSEKVYKALGIESTDNVIYMGYLTDEEMTSVIKNSEALIFPTFYEGFGIPPLEALAIGTKAIVSDIPALKEVYGNTVYYINPNNSNINLQELLEQNIQDREIVLNKYSWEKSAKEMYEILKKYLGEEQKDENERKNTKEKL